MQGLVAKVGLFLAAFILSSCLSPLDERLVSEGIGPRLHVGDMPQQGEVLDRYFGYICDQAAISAVDRSGERPRCVYPAVTRSEWQAVVMQGMNDIDRRCDGYLSWLDNLRRSQQPALTQISQMGTSADAILIAAGVKEALPLALVAQGFGLLHNSLENYYSRLILAAEPSTVNTIVLQKRNRFRKDPNSYLAANKPGAEFVLRAYLRLCLPFTIETDINDLSSMQARGIEGDDGRSVTSSGEVLGVGAAPLRGDARVDITPPSRLGQVPEAGNSWSSISLVAINRQTGQAIQRAICLPAAEVDGINGPKTIEMLKIYESLEAGSIRDQGWRQRQVRLNRQEVNVLSSVASCRSGAKNYLENALLNDPNRDAIRMRIDEKIRVKFNVAGNARFTELRAEIRDWRSELGLDNAPGDLFQDQITPDFVRVIFATP